MLAREIDGCAALLKLSTEIPEPRISGINHHGLTPSRRRRPIHRFRQSSHFKFQRSTLGHCSKPQLRVIQANLQSNHSVHHSQWTKVKARDPKLGCRNDFDVGGVESASYRLLGFPALTISSFPDRRDRREIDQVAWGCL